MASSVFREFNFGKMVCVVVIIDESGDQADISAVSSL